MFLRQGRHLRGIFLVAGFITLNTCWYFILNGDKLEYSDSSRSLRGKSIDINKSQLTSRKMNDVVVPLANWSKEVAGIFQSFYAGVNMSNYIEPLPSLQGSEGNTEIGSTSRKDSQQFPFRYLINEPSACGEQIQIINVVPIAPENIEDRLRIRDLWGNSLYSNITGMKTVFLLGTTDSKSSLRFISAESKHFHDIIQLNFVDSYQNLSFKTLSMLHWTQHYCPSAKWILKSDDDVFVNTFVLMKFLRDTKEDADFVCAYNQDPIVCRAGGRCNSKFAVPHQIYHNDSYPPYCGGPAYVIHSRMARQLYQAASKTHPFIMEDVYFTGMLAQSLKPRYLHLDDDMFPKHKILFRIRSRLFTLLFLHLENNKGASYNLWWRLLTHYKLPFVKKPLPSSLFWRLFEK